MKSFNVFHKKLKPNWVRDPLTSSLLLTNCCPLLNVDPPKEPKLIYLSHSQYRRIRLALRHAWLRIKQIMNIRTHNQTSTVADCCKYLDGELRRENSVNKHQTFDRRLANVS